MNQKDTVEGIDVSKWVVRMNNLNHSMPLAVAADITFREALTKAYQDGIREALEEVERKSNEVFGDCEEYEDGCAGCKVKEILTALQAKLK